MFGSRFSKCNLILAVVFPVRSRTAELYLETPLQTIATANRFSIAIAAALIVLSSYSLGAQSSIIEKNTRLMLDLETPLNSSATQEGDTILFRTRNDIRVLDRIAIPQGTLVKGSAIQVQPAFVNGKAKYAEFQIRFQEIRFSDGTSSALSAEILKLEPEGIVGSSPPNRSMQGMLPGMALGGMLGGRGGAALGSAAGIGIAALGTLKRPKVKGAEIDMPSGSIIEMRLNRSLEISHPPLPIPTPVLAPGAPSPAVQTAPATDQGTPDESPILDLKPVTSQPFNISSLDAGTAPLTATEASPRFPNTPPAKNRGVLTLNVDVKLVQVDAVVRDGAGRIMSGLKREDFRVLEDGIEQQIQNLSRDELPLAVALVIDRSGSVAPFMDRIQSAAFRALQHLKRGDQVALFSFAGDIELLEALTADRQRVANRIGAIRPGGGTRIVDAIDEALAYLGRAAPNRRRAVIVISDNLDGDSRKNVAHVVRFALDSEAVVYSVRIRQDSARFLGLPIPLPRSSRVSPPDPVTLITKDTGGEVFDARTSAMDAALEIAVTRLKLRYTLSYASSAHSSPGRYHATEVQLAERFGSTGPDYTVLSKRGYYE